MSVKNKVLVNAGWIVLGGAVIGLSYFNNKSDKVSVDLLSSTTALSMSLNDLRQSVEIGVKFKEESHLNAIAKKRITLQGIYNSEVKKLEGSQMKGELDNLGSTLGEIAHYASQVSNEATVKMLVNFRKIKTSAEHLLGNIILDLDSLQNIIRQSSDSSSVFNETLRRNQTIKNELNRIVKNLDKTNLYLEYSRNLASYSAVNFGSLLPDNASFQMLSRSLLKNISDLNAQLKPLFTSTVQVKDVEVIENDLAKNLAVIDRALDNIQNIASSQKRIDNDLHIIFLIFLVLLWGVGLILLNKKSNDNLPSKSNVEKFQLAYRKMKQLDQSTSRIVKISSNGEAVVENGFIEPSTFKETKFEKIVQRFNHVLSKYAAVSEKNTSVEQLVSVNVPGLLTKMRALSLQNEGTYLNIENNNLTALIEKLERLLDEQDKLFDKSGNYISNISLNSQGLEEEIANVKTSFEVHRLNMNETAKQVKRAGEETQKLEENLEELKQLHGKISVIGMNLAIEFSNADERFANYSNELQNLLELIEGFMANIRNNILSIRDVSVNSAKSLEDLNNNVVQSDQKVDSATHILGGVRDYVLNVEKNNNKNSNLLSDLRSTLNTLKSYQEVSKLKDVTKNEVLVTTDGVLTKLVEQFFQRRG